MNTAESLESLRKHAASPAPICAGHEDATLLLAKFESMQALGLKIAELQTRLEELPTQEAAIAEDRTKNPADVRAALTVLKDQASDLRFEQKRLEDDKAKTFAEAVALFTKCAQLVSGYFSGCYEAEKAKAIAAITPFFTVGGSTTPESHAADLPTVALARTHAQYAHERVKGESPEETLAKFVEVIKEFGLHKPVAA